MKESQFINQNKEKWAESERVLASKNKDTDQLSSLFIQLVDDLSYARTFFSRRFITVYLNQTSMKFFSLIYTRKKSKWVHFVDFWKEELPQVVIHCRKELLISLAVFILSILIGIVSSANDPQFVASILGDQYVEMTKENINSGDPMAVYKKSNQYEMFMGITINNIMVAFRTYVLGLLAGIGTLMSLLYNGIMLGAFQYFFYEHGLLGTSMLAVWLHGTLEISSIVIAGGAGLTLARGLIIPGTLSRTQSFYRSATRSLKLILGTVPIFIVAGFVESFITRYTEVPNIIRLSFILASLAFIVGYFIIYPYRKAQTGFKKPLEEVKLSATSKNNISYAVVKNNSDIFKDTFFVYAGSFTRLSIPVIAGSALVCLYQHFTTQQNMMADSGWFLLYMQELLALFNSQSLKAVVVTSIILGCVLFYINHVIIKTAEAPAFKPAARYYLFGILNSMLVTGLLLFLIYKASVAGAIFIALLLPFVLLLNFTAHAQQSFFILSLGEFFTILSSGFTQTLGLFAMLIITGALFAIILNSPIMYMYLEGLKMNINPDLKYLQEIFNYLSAVTTGFILLSLLAYILTSISLLYFSAQEIITAHNLKEKISRLRNPKSKYAA